MEIQNILNSNELQRTEFVCHFFRRVGLDLCSTKIFKFYFILEVIISYVLAKVLSCILVMIRHFILCFRIVWLQTNC